MRRNEPVTNREYPFPSGSTLVSMTDLKGRITYCNRAFIEVSGYDKDELMGQPHNLVRHPDMPEEAFRDLWATIESGKPWAGMVKNRRKNGDHYWVRANATPVRDGDRVIAYLSVRSRPERADIEAAEALYASLREQEASGRMVTGLAAGKVVRRDVAGRVLQMLRPGPRALLMSAMVFLAVAAGVAGAILPLAAGAPVVLVLAGCAAWFAQHRAYAPLAQTAEEANRLASGDLTQEPHVTDDGPLGALQHALVQMTVNLRTVTADVRAELGALRTSIAEIATGNEDLSARTEAQASNLEQTAASMEQVNSTIEQSATVAAQSAQLTTTTADIARRSHDSMEAAAAAMEEIRASSGRINEIIQVVEGVSFQTNILALNAAVEAARAGEQGRGFAVVASEVRALAQRTSSAAREIKQLIQEANDRVAIGGQQTGEARGRMKEALESVAGVSSMMNEISATAAEQRSGVAQISEAVMQLDSITQQNAAMVEELAAAAKSVTDQVREATESMAIFRLGGESLADTPLAADAVAMRRQAKAALSVRTAQAPAPAANPGAKARVPATKVPAARVPSPARATVPDAEWAEF